MGQEIKRVGIIGLGPVGQTMAVHMKEAGCEVSITDLDQVKLHLIRKSGIELVGAIEKPAVYFKHVYPSIKELLSQNLDILICAAKAYHVDSIIKHFEDAGKINTYLLSAQNGLGIRRKYTSHFEENKILAVAQELEKVL